MVEPASDVHGIARVHLAHRGHRRLGRQHRDVDGEPEVVQAVRQTPAARWVAAAVEPAPHRPGEAGVVHRPVPARRRRGRGRRRGRARRAASRRRGRRSMVRRTARGHLVGEVVGAEPAGHVGDVDAPAVEPVAAASGRRPSRGRRTGGGPARREAWSSLGRRGDVEPGDVGAVVAEPVEAALGAGRVVRARSNQSWWSPVWLVVRSPTTRSPAAWAASSSRLERGVATEQRVDAVERDGVVAVVGPGLEDRGQVEQRRAEVCQVVEVVGRRRRACRRTTGTGRRAPGARPGRPSRPAAPRRATGTPVSVRSKRSGKTW